MLYNSDLFDDSLVYSLKIEEYIYKQKKTEGIFNCPNKELKLNFYWDNFKRYYICG